MNSRADKRKYHYIYKIVRDDGKYYIGMHSTDNLDDGYFGSGVKITRSIKRHGLDRHTKVILEFAPTRKELRLREAELVNTHTLSDPNCMNLTIGGQRVWADCTQSDMVVETIRNKLSTFWSCEINKKAASEKAKEWWTPERRERQRVLKRQHYHDASVLENVRRATKEALSQPEVKQKMRAAKQNNWQDSQYRERQMAAIRAAKDTSEFRAKMSAAKTGQNNPNYGTRWIFNEELRQSTRISKQLEIPDGWVAGRRLFK